MKRIRKQQAPWYVPPPPPVEATFVCRSCGAAVTGLLRRLDDEAALASKELVPLVPVGTYWPVAAGHLPTSYQGVPVDFTGCYAVGPDALVDVGNHPDRERWVGCCGPSGTSGPNRVCKCGRAIGTERSDCMWPVAVYLDPAAVRPVEPAAEPGVTPDPARG
jgi:hypothetical protein